MKNLLLILFVLFTYNIKAQEMKVSKVVVQQCDGTKDTLEIAYIKEPLLTYKNNLIVFSILDPHDIGYKIIKTNVEWFMLLNNKEK